MAYEVESFTVESYQVSQYHYKNSWVPYITMESAPEAHGIRSRAVIHFWGPADGTVTFPKAYEGMTVDAYPNNTHYQSIYSLLQAESPVQFSYLYEQPTGSTLGAVTKLLFFWLSTGKEPTGEGLEGRRPAFLAPIFELLADENAPAELKAEIRAQLPEEMDAERTDAPTIGDEAA